MNRIQRYAVLAALVLAAAARGQVTQTADATWAPAVSAPAFDAGAGPVVLVDAAHGNFHTIDGRYAAFAALLGQDGYRVVAANDIVSANLLDRADVYVISNAIAGGDEAEWTLPVPSAFSDHELDCLVEWVRNGGSLLLIADHMPFPGATARLANRFGIIFLNGFALDPGPGNGRMTFSRHDNSLADHPITRGRAAAELIDSVTSFTGQAFRFVDTMQPLMHLPDHWVVLLPSEAWVFDDTTATVSARGLVQGAVMKFGAGRVAVFGEAAMFTAQTSTRDGVVRRMGMSHPDAPQNAQFLLNVMHWLSGLLDDPSF